MLYAKMAMQVADQQGNKEVVEKNRQLLEEYYEAGKPYHESPPVQKAHTP